MKELFQSCPSCLTSLADHLRAIAAERDQTKLSGLLLQVLKDTLLTSRSALFRYVGRKDGNFVIVFAELANVSLTTHDAYLLSSSRGVEIEKDSNLERCVRTESPVVEVCGGRHVSVFPVFRRGIVHLLVELERTAPFDTPPAAE